METKSEFKKDVLEGLGKPRKELMSKYFYDDQGSRIYQEIMNLKEYYLPECELEILTTRTAEIAALLPAHQFDVIELGAGDGRKTVHFLKRLTDLGREITYHPVDISTKALAINIGNIKKRMPALPIYEVAGDYFDTLHQLEDRSPKMIMFMGSNIGNYPGQKALEFLSLMRENMDEGDLLLVGIDLRKNPNIILKAYNDKKGVTKRFNLNLLERINRELGADIDTAQFDHYPFYDPISGTAYSYLVSLQAQSFHIGDQVFHLPKDELIRTEVSQKYSTGEIDRISQLADFASVHHFLDSRAYFSVSVFQK